MKSLYESLLDDEDIVIDKLDIKPLIEEWLKKYSITNYKINEDDTIDVKGRVLIQRYPESELPPYIQFRNIAGGFSITGGKLKTLRGCPEKVSKSFDCCGCSSLKTLEGGPKEVGKSFDCRWCSGLTSLEGAPGKVGEDFYCSFCEKLNVTEKDIRKICTVEGNINI